MRRRDGNEASTAFGFGVGSGVALILLLVICLGAWGCPQYNVYRQRLGGQAQLQHAESSRKIAIREAEAKRDSAAMLAEAEVARARGVAEANKIIGDSLKDNDAYLRYLWIENLDSGNGERIYIPTEAGLPILEARPRP